MATPITMSETQRFEKENRQTACNMDLFDEDNDMEDTESWTQSGKRGTSQMDLDQPSTRTALLCYGKVLTNKQGLRASNSGISNLGKNLHT